MTTQENISELFQLLKWAKTKQKYRGQRSGEYQNGIEASILMLRGQFDYIQECDESHDIPKVNE